MGASWNHLKLEARTLSCVRGGRMVYAGLDFAVESGEALILRGANGCGKSSLLRQIAGLLPLAAGAIEWRAQDSDEPIGECLHYVGHLNAVKPYLSVGENLAFWAQMLGGPVTIEAAANFWGLSGLLDTPASILSQGQRQRVSLARLLLVHRPLWLLDEPQAGLDSTNRERLQQALLNHLEGGGMALVASHSSVEVADARDLDMTALATATADMAASARRAAGEAA
jgi:heme exporter protein A